MRMAGNGVRLAMLAVMAVLAGCSAGDTPPGTPGSLATHLNGRIVAGLGGRP